MLTEMLTGAQETAPSPSPRPFRIRVELLLKDRSPSEHAAHPSQKLVDQGNAELGRSLASHGRLRLSGDGVRANSARLDDTGELMVTVQRLVSAFGASLRGIKSHRGPLGEQIRSLTQLRLEATPVAGSVVLRLTPEKSPSDELYPSGDVSMFSPAEEPLIDESMFQLVRLLNDVADDVADSDEPDLDSLAEEIGGLGPRVASVMKVFADSLVEDAFSLDIEWEAPGKPTLRSHLGTSGAELLSTLVGIRDLDAEPVELRGVLHTGVIGGSGNLKATRS